MPPGTYTLLVEVPEPIAVAFGAGGTRELAAGWATYTGSAFGPGGLARVDRHRELARGDREVRHWHVDHLLGHPATRLAEAWVTPGEAVECRVHRGLPGREVPAGASDCRCRGHLRWHRDREPLARALAEAHERRRSEGARP